MPKSARNKVIKLTAVKKNSQKVKHKLLENIRAAIENVENVHVYTLSLKNQRNAPLKHLRARLSPGRIFYGKNKVMQRALGTAPENELENDLHLLSQYLNGQTALLISSEEPSAIRQKVESFCAKDYAKAGNIATDDITLSKGTESFEDMPGTLEPTFRQFGLPTVLVNGKISLLADFQVCKQGQALSPTQTHILNWVHIGARVNSIMKSVDVMNVALAINIIIATMVVCCVDCHRFITSGNDESRWRLAGGFIHVGSPHLGKINVVFPLTAVAIQSHGDVQGVNASTSFKQGNTLGSNGPESRNSNVSQAAENTKNEVSIVPRFEFTRIETLVKRALERIFKGETRRMLSKVQRPMLRLDESGVGHVNTKVAHVLAKEAGINEDDLAAKLAGELAKDVHAIKRSTPSSNAYVNFMLEDEYVWQIIKDMEADEQRLGVPKFSRDTVVIDYFGPNIGKPLHMGHLRCAAIGSSIANILEFCGCKTHRRNHIGDYGAHAGAIMRYIAEFDVNASCLFTGEVDVVGERDRTQTALGYSGYALPRMRSIKQMGLPSYYGMDNIMLRTMGKYYQLATETMAKDADFARRVKIETAKLQQGTSAMQKHWSLVSRAFRGYYRRMLVLFNFSGLKDMPESLYGPKARGLVESLITRGIAMRNPDSSVVVPLEDGKDAVLVTQYGALSYLAIDVTALKHRIKNQCPNRLVYVTDEAQSEHFKRVVQVAKMAGFLGETRVEHIGFAPVKMITGKKIRSRTDETEDLWKLVETLRKKVLVEYRQRLDGGSGDDTSAIIFAQRIATGSMIYAELSTKHHLSYCFTLDRLLNQGGNNLVTILYSHVRAKAILRKINDGTFNSDPEIKQEPNKTDENKSNFAFDNEHQRNLALGLAMLDAAVLDGLYKRAPHKLCKYLYSLAKRFNRFYETNRVIAQDGTVSQTSLTIVKLFTKTIDLVLTLLDIEPVERL